MALVDDKELGKSDVPWLPNVGNSISPDDCPGRKTEWSGILHEVTSVVRKCWMIIINRGVRHTSDFNTGGNSKRR